MRAGVGGNGPHPGTLAVAHLCAPARVGGLERVVQGLARGQRERGHRVSVVAVIEPGADLEAFLGPLVAAGVEAHQVTVRGRDYLGERKAVRRFLQQWKPDILHTHGYRSDVLNGGMARRMGIATVSTLHGSSRMGGFSHFFEWIQERALRRFHGVVAVSAPLRAALLAKGVPPRRLHLVPNAWTAGTVPLSREQARATLGVRPEGLRIGWVGRLVSIKGPDVFLRALAGISGDPSWRASMVGDGPEHGRADELVRSLGLTGRVDLHGAIPDAERLFPAFDVLVLSSRSEGMPMVVLEAIASGVPVVATAVGGVPDLLGERGGWLVRPEDPTALGSAIERALADPHEREERAMRARAGLDGEYGPERWLTRHERVYETALAISRSGARTRKAPAPGGP
jgi:glycosyltransferase involved in cell wall biosynthesis